LTIETNAVTELCKSIIDYWTFRKYHHTSVSNATSSQSINVSHSQQFTRILQRADLSTLSRKNSKSILLAASMTEDSV